MQTNPYATDQEGYIQNMEDWSDSFVKALAKKEELELTENHWEVIGFIHKYYEEHQVQAQVRDMIKFFKQSWDSSY